MNPSRSTLASHHRSLVVLLSLVFVCLIQSHASAHPEGFSGIHVTIDNDQIRVAITVHTRDMGAWFPPGKYPDYVADVTGEMQRTVGEIVELHINQEAQAVAAANAFLLEVGLIELDVDFKLPVGDQPIEILIWSKHLIYLPRGHQQLLFIEDRRQLAPGAEQGVILLDDILTVQRDAGAAMLPVVKSKRGDEPTESQPEERSHEPDTTTSEVPPETSASAPQDRPARSPKVGTHADKPTSRISFFLFGVEHILTGYDHLLFLAALLLACKNFSEAAKIITCFTLAHSVTLALAALDVVRLPGWIVETLIAASIVYVAVENLSSEPSLRRRVGITCFFGLIHGLGFASALRDIGLGSIPGGVVWPLLKFNLGVEAGQLCVAAIVFPLIMWAKRSERLSKYITPTGSIIVAMFGAYWLVTRLLAGP